MLDSETKRRIDTARDILVGKIPDPKSQVEQITIALIYKFMDDMDNESVEMGGKRRFFVGEFEKYAWTKIFDPRLGGFEMLALYSDAITRMTQNTKIPQLFRDIFKNAYLPYRDPETLKLFLKTIHEFRYDHSERLGDAFEYLLSVLGSQGDAGQFRTPRHIIEFMTSVIKPQKTDIVLDPACGTAGFLISAYKHIMATHRKKNALNPEEHKRVLDNIKGYDISPDMVRLSLVNLYLHGFVQPHIFEYDTLSSEDRWNEYADVVLANPPFMSPKGGIKPHKKFSVQSNRSEVLFVDYIAEHLTPTGRAAVIVPEGIIFQSAGAYKQLRKMLVEDRLFAVVSLPAGVFNPYSGVKTSILFMDRRLARKADSILFVKVEKDGYGLGAQRRPLCSDNGDKPELCPQHSDLPAALNALDTFAKAIRSGTIDTVDTTVLPDSALVVSKDTLAESGDYNLTADRYRTADARIHQKWPMVKVQEVISTITPPKKIQKSEFKISGKYPIIDQSQNEIAGWSDEEDAVINPVSPLVVFGDHTCAVKYVEKPFIQGADGIKIIACDDKLLSKYFFFTLKTRSIESDGYKRHFSKLKESQIPLPPLEVQRQIVAEIEGYQKIIDGARQVVEHYKPHIDIDPDWPMVKLGEVFYEIKNGKNVEQSDNEGKYRVSRIQTISEWKVDLSKTKWTNNSVNEKDFLREGDILLSHINSMDHLAKSALFTGIEEKVVHGINLIRFRPNFSLVEPKFIYTIFISSSFIDKARTYAQKAVNQASIKTADLKQIEVPLPPLDVQREIVAAIDAERQSVESCRQLIALYEAKIKRTIDKVWDA
ncbi:MAG: N-6 DNA methylase [Phycisphaerae bacterium]|nr:N-6 DNA methylase [Phycisphaerae bacterium]